MKAQSGGQDTHKEGDEDSSIHEDQGHDGGPAVAKTVGDRSCQEDTDKSTTLAGLEEGTLPLSFDGIVFTRKDTVCLCEDGKGDKITVQEHVERLHDLVDVG